MILLEVTLLLELLASAPHQGWTPAAHMGSVPANTSWTSLQTYQEDPASLEWPSSPLPSKL